MKKRVLQSRVWLQPCIYKNESLTYPEFTVLFVLERACSVREEHVFISREISLVQVASRIMHLKETPFAFFHNAETVPTCAIPSPHDDNRETDKTLSESHLKSTRSLIRKILFLSICVDFCPDSGSGQFLFNDIFLRQRSIWYDARYYQPRSISITNTSDAAGGSTRRECSSKNSICTIP